MVNDCGNTNGFLFECLLKELWYHGAECVEVFRAGPLSPSLSGLLDCLCSFRAGATVIGHLPRSGNGVPIHAEACGSVSSLRESCAERNLELRKRLREQTDVLNGKGGTVVAEIDHSTREDASKH